MEHVASVPPATSGRMSPGAVGLAVVLHVLLALLLWWAVANRPVVTPAEEPIEITMERPRPPDPPPQPEPPPKPQPKVEQPPMEGLRPPAEETADRRTQRKPTGEAPKDIAGPPPESLEQEVPAPPPPPPPPRIEAAKPTPEPPPPVQQPPVQQQGPKPPQVAMARPEAVPPPSPPKPAEPPPPAPAKPSTPAVTSIHPQQRPPPPTTPHAPPAISPNPQIRPSPLVARPQQQPPAIAGREQSQPSSPFVNPADERNRALVQDNYLWQVIGKLRGYRYHANVPVREGLTVVQVVIARDGRLLDARVVSSSGIAAMDQGVLAGVRQGSPYTPLPPQIKGASATFRLPLVSVPEQR